MEGDREMSITILKSSVLAAIQDRGRFGYQKYGIVAGGAMDQAAARIANMLVGNEESDAVLELTLVGAELRIEQNLWLAICGADMGPVADGVYALPLWRPIYLPAGSVVTFKQYRSGCRTYIAVAGGFQVPMVMGSRSTYMRGGIGGHEGRALRAGDKLETDTANLQLTVDGCETTTGSSIKSTAWHAGGFAIAGFAVSESETHLIRAIPGTHLDWLSSASKDMLFGEDFQIGVQSDRMGYRLQSEERLQLVQSSTDLLSEPVTLGTVQLPPDGNPIVLLADRQTTGGYPRIAQIAAVDIGVFAQLKPGDKVRFEAVSGQEAEELLLASEKDMSILKSAIKLKVRRF